MEGRGCIEQAKVLFVARNLVIKVTAGEDEAERCNQAFTVASTAIASGVDVSLWLTGEASWFALPGRAEGFSLPHAAPLADLLASVLALGTVTICSQCAARRDITPQDVTPPADEPAVPPRPAKLFVVPGLLALSDRRSALDVVVELDPGATWFSALSSRPDAPWPPRNMSVRTRAIWRASPYLTR